MGRAERPKPKRLGEKLKTIREGLGLSFEEMIAHLNFPQIPLHRSSIYRYEIGKLEPPLQILLQYGKLINISTDILIDDDEDLPFKKLFSEK